MKKALVLLVACFAFVGAACGGGSDDSSSSGSSSGSSSDSSSDQAKGDSDSDFCDLARKFEKDFENAGNGTDSQDTAALFKDLRSAIDQLEQKAPKEIEADVKVVAKAFRESDDLLKKYDYDFTKVPQEEADKVSLDDPEVTKASDNVESYFETTCGIDSDGDGDTDGKIDNSGTSSTTETTAQGE